jgi:hypothetical protein
MSCFHCFRSAEVWRKDAAVLSPPCFVDACHALLRIDGPQVRDDLELTVVRLCEYMFSERDADRAPSPPDRPARERSSRGPVPSPRLPARSRSPVPKWPILQTSREISGHRGQDPSQQGRHPDGSRWPRRILLYAVATGAAPLLSLRRPLRGRVGLRREAAMLTDRLRLTHSTTHRAVPYRPARTEQKAGILYAKGFLVPDRPRSSADRAQVS